VQQSFWHQVDGQARRFVPFGLTLILLLFAVTPKHLPGLAYLTPMYSLMAVYFWAIYRPDLLGYGACFAIGVLEDLLTGTPLGSSALVLLLCHWTVLHQYKFFHNKPFMMTWAAFGIVAAAASLLRWISVGLVATSGFTSFADVFGSYLMTMAVFPLVAWLLAKVQMKLLSQ